MHKRYLILYDSKSFYTDWYEYENNYSKGTIIVDFYTHKVTFNGVDWVDIEDDNL